MMINNFYWVTDEGELLERNWRDKYDDRGFGANKKIDYMQWDSGDKFYKKKLGVNFMPQLLPDSSGFLNVEGNQKEIVFYEPDMRQRFRVAVPAQSRPSGKGDPYFYYVKFRNETKCEILFFDGFGDSVGDLNLLTGEITNIRETRV